MGRPRGDSQTAAKLVEAAAREFQEHGFAGTDSNRIARRAGFAPQTFYRWFSDKIEIFVAVYHEWVREEFEALEVLQARGAGDLELIDAVIAHHRAYVVFRRSLRQLTVENDQVRKARAASRLMQIGRILSAFPGRGAEETAILLLQYERLCDGVADGEFADLGVSEQAVRRELLSFYERMRRA